MRLLGILKDVTGDYHVAFLFLGFSQMFGAVMALLAIICRRHKSFCFIAEKTSLGARRRSQEALLSNIVEPSNGDTKVENLEEIGIISANGEMVAVNEEEQA